MSDASESTKASDDAPTPGSDAGPLRRWARRVLRVGSALALLFATVLGALLLILQTQTGSTAAARYLARTANPFPETELTIGSASGSWLRSLQLTDVTLARVDTTSAGPVRLAHIDTVSATYNVGALLWGHAEVTRASIEGPSVTMRQAPDSTWDWARMLAADPASTPDTATGEAFPVSIEQLRVTGGQFAAQFYAAGRDSTARIRGLEVRADSIRLGDRTEMRLDTLGLQGRLPADSSVLRLTASGHLTNARLAIDTLDLASPRSRLGAGGSVRLPETPDDVLDDVALRVQADPLVLGDLTAFAPTLGVDPAEAITLDARVSGSGQMLTVEADGQFSGGGTLTAQARGTPRATGGTVERPLQYELDLTADDLTTSLLGPLAPEQNLVSGSVDASLKGPSLDTLDGQLNVSVETLRSGSIGDASLTLRSTVDEGRAALDASGTVGRSEWTLRGHGRPFDAQPAFDVTAGLENLRLSDVAPDAPLEATLTASTRIQGAQIGSDQAAYDLATRLGPSQFAAQPIRDGKISVSITPTDVQIDGDLTFPTGRLAVAGRAFRDDSERFVLEHARLENVDLAALAGDTTGARVTGTARAEGRGWSPSTTAARARLSIDRAQYAHYRLEKVQSSVQLNAGRLTGSTEGHLDGATWGFRLAGRPFADRPTAEISEGRFHDLDLAPLLQDSTLSSALHGTFRGEVTGTTPATLAADAHLTIDSSRVNRQRIERGTVDVSIEAGQLASTVRVEGPDGSIDLALDGEPFADRPTFRLPSASFENVNVGAIAGAEGLSTRLTGTATGRVEGTSPAALSLASEIRLENSRINEAQLPSGRITASGENGLFSIEGTATVAGGTLQYRGEIDSLDATPSYSLTARGNTIDLAALSGLDTEASIERARLTARGRGQALADLSASTSLSARGVSFDRVRLDTAAAAGTLDGGLLTVDTLSVRSNVLNASGEGPVALTQRAGSSNFDLEANVTDLAPLRPLLGARVLSIQKGRLDAHVYGGADNQRFDGRAHVDGFIYDDLRLGKTDVAFNGARGTEQILGRVSIEADAGYMAFGGVSANRAELDGQYDGSRAALSGTVVLDDQRRVQLEASTDPAAAPLAVRMSRFDVRLGPDRWSLANETTITVGDDYRVENLRLESENSRLEADGTLSTAGTQSLVVTAEQVRLGGLTPLFGLGDLGGDLTGRLAVTGSAADPQMDGRLDLALRSKGSDVGTLHVEGTYDDLETTFTGRLVHAEGGTLRTNGRVPMDLRLRAEAPADVSTRPVRLEAATEAFPIDWMDPFLDPATARSVKGTLVGNVEIRGTLDDPDLGGQVSLADAGAYLTPLETAFRDGTVRFQLEDDQIRIEDGQVFSTNGGRLRVSGQVDFPELTVGQYNLSLEASDLLAVDTRAYQGTVIDGSLRLEGTTSRPNITGRVEVERGTINYAEALAETAGSATQVPLTAQDQLVLEERFGLRVTAADTTTFDFYEASTLDLTVELQRDTWLRSTSNPEMNVQFEGDLDVQKQPNRDPDVYGTIDVLEGQSTVRQFGQEFDITEGTLTFSGNPYLPLIDFSAVYEQRARGTQGTEVRITLTLSGRPDSLTPALSSDPPMSTRNILSYLATGRPAEDILGGDTEGGNLATRVAIGQATNFVENLAASELGLDIVRLDIRPEGVSYLTVGRYFTSRFFASIEQPVITSSAQTSVQSQTFVPDVTLEYQFTDYLLLRSLSGQQSLQLHLLFQYAY